MLDIIIRLGILLFASLVTWGVVWTGRRYVEQQRRQALSDIPAPASQEQHFMATGNTAQARILAFSSEDCRQCHQLQAPALRRVQVALGERVTVVEVDAPGSPELTRRFHILTVPSTVVLDAAGQAQAVNYGFAPAQKLIAQVQDVVMQKQPA